MHDLAVIFEQIQESSRPRVKFSEDFFAGNYTCFASCWKETEEK